jgi:hypothetical protein
MSKTVEHAYYFKRPNGSVVQLTEEEVVRMIFLDLINFKSTTGSSGLSFMHYYEAAR